MIGSPIMPMRTMAQPLDRLSGFLVDLMILTPAFTLLAAPFERWILLEQLSGEENFVAVLMWSKLLTGALLIWLYHAGFWFFKGATPGEKFWHLKVTQFPSDLPITLSQASARALWFLICLMVMGLPMLALWLHPLRRTFYDRVADVSVRSTSFTMTLPPNLRERRQARMLQSAGVGFLIMVLMLQVFMNVLEPESESEVCHIDRVIDRDGNWIDEREDVALAFFAVKRIDERCLQAIGERAYQVRKTPMGLVALALSAEKELRREYQKFACENHDMRLACRTLKMVEYYERRDWEPLQRALAKVSLSSPLYHRVMALQLAMNTHNIPQAESLVAMIPVASPLLELRMKSLIQIAKFRNQPEKVDRILSEVQWYQSTEQQVATLAWRCRWEMEGASHTSDSCQRLSHLSHQLNPKALSEEISSTVSKWAKRGKQKNIENENERKPANAERP